MYIHTWTSFRKAVVFSFRKPPHHCPSCIFRGSLLQGPSWEASQTPSSLTLSELSLPWLHFIFLVLFLIFLPLFLFLIFSFLYNRDECSHFIHEWLKLLLFRIRSGFSNTTKGHILHGSLYLLVRVPPKHCISYMCVKETALCFCRCFFSPSPALTWHAWCTADNFFLLKKYLIATDLSRFSGKLMIPFVQSQCVQDPGPLS